MHLVGYFIRNFITCEHSASVTFVRYIIKVPHDNYVLNCGLKRCILYAIRRYINDLGVYDIAQI